ncbi:BON domain-containing protein [Brucella pseudogrignonensis]|jgi:OOP family OmpA-OmpF porin|uniref:BON domain protein n=1 Tax=Brucella pseudogrignonensis TaxID=419475 RepID=A0A256GFI5_9HYPH|nr:BON domain-containing protein [Brucella pseudogrignonensis]EMG54951.1 outer membrane porin F precursor [Ochrobactrum sp. CDB2]NNV20759.1 BON domain-containing protein [Brucella pseudogrignonensis]OYR25700.1 BON domain protein [Brucella pseudogrignonensis]
MMKWFWPGVTWTAALTSLALWFGAERVETDIAERTGHALSPYAWTGFDVDGRDVVLKGMAPDPESQQLAVKALQEVDGIGDLSDLTTVLQEASPYVFKLTKNNEGIVLSGFIPDNGMRDSIMSAAESAGDTNLVDDQMALARGAPPEFQDRVLLAIDLAKKMAGSDIEISDGIITIKGHALNDAAYDELTALLKAPLPLGLKLSSSEIARP